MPQVGRIITVVLTVVDEKEASKIWDAHMDSSVLIAGCRVGTISNGDVPAERDKLEKEIGNLDEDEA
jgi:hypothetical protein